MLQRQGPKRGRGTIAVLDETEDNYLMNRQIAIETERKQLIMERKVRKGLPIKGELLSKEERESRMWAFMYDPLMFDCALTVCLRSFLLKGL